MTDWTASKRARISAAHKSATRDRTAGPQIERLRNIDGIKRITLGYTRNHRTHWPKGHVRVHCALNGALKLYVYGDRGFTEAYAYCDADQMAAIKLAVEGAWPTK